jgi:hypothetical protein
MLKKLLGSLAAIIIVVPLGVVFLPLFYMMAWMLALLLPFVCVSAVIQDARGDGSLGFHKAFLGNIAVAALVVPLAIMAFAAPLRVLLLAPLSFFPAQIAEFNEVHGFIYDPFIALFGQLFPYWLDVYWGIFSLLTICLIALCDSIRRNRLTRQIEVLPTAKIRSVAVGKEGGYIRRRNVVVQLLDKESGKKYTARFGAAVGSNDADDVQAFEFLHPGEYELDVYLETYYRSGFYNRGSRRASPRDIRLQE